MIASWKVVYNALVGSEELTNRLGHSESDRRIIRGYQAINIAKPCVVFRQSGGSKLVPEISSIKREEFIIAVYDETSDKSVQEIMNIVENILDNSKITDEDAMIYDCSFESYLGTTYWDEKEDSYLLRARFSLIVREK